MIHSPLQLERYFFTQVHVEAPTGRSQGEHNFLSKIETSVNQDDPRRWQIRLRLESTDTKRRDEQYQFILEVVGYFAVHPKYPDEKMRLLVEANASAVLYGAAREMLANVTARGPYSAIQLPTVMFIDQPKTTKQSARKSKKTTPQKKARKKITRKKITAKKK